jgi:hypothetical protein
MPAARASHVRRRLLLVVAIVLASCAPATSRIAPPIVVVAANQSFNWAGYMQGALEKGTTFHSVAADWIVPKVRQHRAGEAEHSASWIGIGGGCLDTSCAVTDATLIQAGVGHDVDAAGDPDYYTWYETIPEPLIRTPLAVRPGDRVRVVIAESASIAETWTITILNVTSGLSFAITLAYPSTYGTAEWIVETTVAISETGITVGPMPDLAVVQFDGATVNGQPAAFRLEEQIQLVDLDLAVIALPSAPDRQADGFNDCTFRKSCPVPGAALH